MPTDMQRHTHKQTGTELTHGFKIMSGLLTRSRPTRVRKGPERLVKAGEGGTCCAGGWGWSMA